MLFTNSAYSIDRDFIFVFDPRIAILWLADIPLNWLFVISS